MLLAGFEIHLNIPSDPIAADNLILRNIPNKILCDIGRKRAHPAKHGLARHKQHERVSA